MENNQLLFDSTPQGNVKVEVFFQDENFWLTQKAMAALFDVAVPTISKHLNNIYELENYINQQLFPFWKQFKKKATET